MFILLGLYDTSLITDSICNYKISNKSLNILLIYIKSNQKVLRLNILQIYYEMYVVSEFCLFYLSEEVPFYFLSDK